MRPKILVVTSLLVVGLAAVGFSGPLSGKWTATGTMEYDANERVLLTSFETIFDIDYTLCGWTFGALSRFDKDCFQHITFDAAGSVGAIDLFSKLDFYTRYTRFQYWGNLVTLSIAGVDLYAISFVSNRNYFYPLYIPGYGWLNFLTTTLTDSIATGLLVGGWGDFGDCTVVGQVRYNVAASSELTIYYHGYDWVRSALGIYNPAYSGIGCLDGWSYLGVVHFLPQTASCCLCWTGAKVSVFYPFACFDLLTTLNFTCHNGLDLVSFQLEDICLGLSWLELEKLIIRFEETQTKSVRTHFCLVVADCLCFTPYLSLVTSANGTTIDGIAFNALTVGYNMAQGVTFKAGTLFSNYVWYGCAEAWYWEVDALYGFTETGEVSSSNEFGSSACVHNRDYDEYFGVFIDGDSCCGSLFDVWIMNWFNDSQTTGFMDWAETVLNLSVGIGSNTTLNLKTSLKPTGLSCVKAGIEFIF